MERLDLSLERLEQRLRERAGQATADDPEHQRAAVAALLRWEPDGPPEVLLMKRAERPGDRWSGQVSLPGGREERGDADLLATALRETREEVGLELDGAARLLGSLMPVRAMANGRLLPLMITPYVFLATEPLQPRPGPEAAHVFWFPLERAASGALDDRHLYDTGQARLKLPCWRWEGEVIWGLTYRMLAELLERLR